MKRDGKSKILYKVVGKICFLEKKMESSNPFFFVNSRKCLTLNVLLLIVIFKKIINNPNLNSIESLSYDYNN